MKVWRVVVKGTEITDERREALRRAGMSYLSGHGTLGLLSRTIVAVGNSEADVKSRVAHVLGVEEGLISEARAPPVWVYAPVEPDGVERFREAAQDLITAGRVSILEQEAPVVAYEAAFEVEQAAPEVVFAQARKLYADICARAGLSVPDPLELRASGFEVFLPRQREDEVLLTRAAELSHQGHHDLAVIVAQTACEVLVGNAMRLLLPLHPSEALQDWLLDRLKGYSLNDDPTRRLWNRLTSTEIQKEGWWPDYKTHVQRRHDIAHKGAHADKTAAQESLNAVRNLIRFVESRMPTAPDDDAGGVA